MVIRTKVRPPGYSPGNYDAGYLTLAGFTINNTRWDSGLRVANAGVWFMIRKPYGQNDTSGDGMSDAAKFLLRDLGFDWQAPQHELVATLYNNAGAAGLFTREQFDANREAGQSDVLADPSAFDLWTPEAIMDLNLGGLMLLKTGDVFQLRLQLQSTPDLSTTPFANHGDPVVIEVVPEGAKNFLRVRALGPQ